MLSGTPHMLLAVNPTSLGSNPADFVAIGSTTYFTADDGYHGRELWKSDGTAAGTVMVADITPGSGNSYLGSLTNLNGTLYFGDSNAATAGLWKSDGTAAGTVPVANVGPDYMINANGKLYFWAYQTGHDWELWKSDGTAAGTVLVKDGLIDVQGSLIDPELTNVNGMVFFRASDGVHGTEVWRSDGTTAGTFMVKDIDPGSYSSYPRDLTNLNGTLFFDADDGTNGAQLWKSDGTAAGTRIVKKINPHGSASPVDLTVVNGTLFFSATDGTAGGELWKSDGTATGTVLAKDFVNGGWPTNLTSVNGTLFFSEDDGTHGSELWKSDGTSAGTVMVEDTYPPNTALNPYALTNVNGTLFFVGTSDNSPALWKSDGTTAGTVVVKDINAGGNPNFGNLTNVNGTLVFTADDGIHGTELWQSDGTVAGTVLVKDINRARGRGYASDFTAVGSTTFFVADDGIGNGLWKTNGTTAGTTLVQEFDPPSSGSYPAYLTNLNGTLFFTDGGELWKSDGTAAGTALVSTVDVVSPLTAVNGNLYFAGNDGVNGTELWKSDGTASGTTMVKDVFPGSYRQYYQGYYGGWYYRYVPNSSNPADLINRSGVLYFTANDGADGRQLWKSDGTAAGTVMVTDVNPGSIGLDPSDLTNINGEMFFTANDGTHGYELWKSDGTAAGTAMVKDINSGASGSAPGNLINVNGTLFFSADDGVHGQELWKSDGTASDTVLVKDINPGSTNSFPTRLTAVNNTLFFTANDGTDGAELWKSDGSAAGTALVKDINPGSAGSNPSYLTNVSGTLYFAANDGTDGAELWQSDGTSAGTILVADINPGSAGSYPAFLTDANGTLFFRADDGVHGPQPWVLNGSSAASFDITGFSTTITAGTATSFTVTAENPDGTTDTNYTGTVNFSSSDLYAGLPSSYTFQRADAGTAQFQVTFNTGGNQTMTVSDAVDSILTGSATVSVTVPLPTTSGLSVASAPEGSSDLTLTVTGTNFAGNSLVQWNGVGLATTYVSATQLQALVPAADLANHGTAAVTVFSPTPGGGMSNAQTFTITNVAPTASISAPTDGYQGVQGQSRTFTLSASDPSPADMAAGFTFAITWGDGTPVQTVTGLSGMSVSHVYITAGGYTVSVTATDQGGATGPAANRTVPILVAELQGNTLMVGGTPGNDTFIVTPAATAGSFQITLNGKSAGTFTPPGPVDIFGYAGTNKIRVNGTAANDTFTIDALTATLDSLTLVADSIQGWTLNGLGGDNTLTVLSVIKGVPVTFSGGTGTNTLVGSNVASTWNVIKTNGGSLTTRPATGTVSFSQVQNLVGGSGGNVFKVGPAGTVQTIDGGSGGSNWLDYVGFASSSTVNVNLVSGAASNVGGGATGAVRNIQNVQGGAGNNTLIGGGGNIFIGGGGSNTFSDIGTGSLASSRSLLIGGTGSAQLSAGAAGDIFIAGTTGYDSNYAALQSILAEWQSADSYLLRFQRLEGLVSGGLNGINKLVWGSTVKDSDLASVLNGGAGLDWFFASSADDTINGLNNPGPEHLNNAP